MIKPNEISNASFLDMKLFPLIETEILLNHCQGKNEKGLLVVIFEQETRSELVPFLEKILGAVKFNLDKDACLLTITDKMVFSLMTVVNQSEKAIEQVLFFGQMPKQVGLNLDLSKYQPTKIGRIELLFADDLAVIQDDNNLKKALWAGLQSMFLK